MRKYTDPAFAIFLICSALWMFQDAMSETIIDANKIEKSALEAVVLTVGQGECSAKVNLTVWDSMNQLEIYRWVVECEARK